MGLSKALKAVLRQSTKRLGMSQSVPPPQRYAPALHKELTEFSDRLRETEEEEHVRVLTLARLSGLLERIDAGNFTTHVFGSASTNLRLPNGDIDICIKSASATDERQLLRRLGRDLRRSRITSDILVIPNAKIPIIRWVDAQTGIQVDACVNRLDGLRTSAMLAQSTAAMPALRPLVLFLKAQLQRSGLNETVNGGVGSYLLSNMVKHVLATPPPPVSLWDSWPIGAPSNDVVPSPSEDLGGQLLRFYWYFGHQLDLSSTVVMLPKQKTLVAPTPGSHRSRSKSGFVPHQVNLLSLTDPANPGVDLGAKAYRFADVRYLLRKSYDKLSKLAESSSSSRHRGLLHELVPRWEAELGDIEQRRAMALRHLTQPRPDLAPGRFPDGMQGSEVPSASARGRVGRGVGEHLQDNAVAAFQAGLMGKEVSARTEKKATRMLERMKDSSAGEQPAPHPKSLLNTAAQKRWPDAEERLTKYVTKKNSKGRYSSIVRLPSGSVTGEKASTKKLAERSAAEQALAHFFLDKPKKRKKSRHSAADLPDLVQKTDPESSSQMS